MFGQMDTTVMTETRTVGDLAVGNGLRGHTRAGSSIVGKGATANTFFAKVTGANWKSSVGNRTTTPVPPDSKCIFWMMPRYPFLHLNP